MDRADAHQMRRDLIDRLDGERRPDLADRLRRCGIPTSLTCMDCGHVHESLTRCKNKWCPACQRYLSAIRAEKIRFAVSGMSWPLFLTLTQGNTTTIDEEDVRGIRRAFGKLRNRKFWKTKVRGGVAAFEVTNIGNGWHLHLHAVIDCDWLSILSSPPRRWHTKAEKEWKVLVAKSELQEMWRQCLKQGADPIVHVKRVDHGIVAEVVKYTIKGEDLLTMQDEIGPLIDAMDGTRMMTTFGNCYRLTARMEEIEGESSFLCPAGHSNWMPANMVESMLAKVREEHRKKPSRFRIGIDAVTGPKKNLIERKAERQQDDLKKALKLPKEAVMPESQSPEIRMPKLSKKKLIIIRNTTASEEAVN